MRRTHHLRAMALVFIGTIATEAAATDWTFQITPYAWLTGLSGDISTGSQFDPVDVDLSFSDILDDLDGAGMLLANARNGPWVLLFDSTYSRVTTNEELGGILLSDVDIESTTTTLSFAIGHRVFETPQMIVDAHAGARAWWLDNDTTIRTVGERSRRIKQSENWIDPIVGVTGVWRFEDRWTVFASLEAGGFGLGSEAQTSVFAGASYAITDLFAATFGWRRLDVDYRDGDFRYDATQSGPVLGATFRF